MSFHPNEIARRARVASFLLFATSCPRRRVLSHAGRPARAVRAQVGAESSARSSVAGAPRHHSRSQRRRHRRERSGLLGLDSRPERRLASRDPSAAERNRSARAVADRGNRPQVSSGSDAPDGRPSRCGLRRDLRARGARARFPRPDHPVGAEAVVPARPGRRGVRGIHPRDHRRPARGTAVRRLRAGPADRGQRPEGQYEKLLRGREGTRFVEYERGREVRRGAGGRQDLVPEGAPDLNTNIDLDLQSMSPTPSSATRSSVA